MVRVEASIIGKADRWSSVVDEYEVPDLEIAAKILGDKLGMPINIRKVDGQVPRAS